VRVSQAEFSKLTKALRGRSVALGLAAVVLFSAVVAMTAETGADRPTTEVPSITTAGNHSSPQSSKGNATTSPTHFAVTIRKPEPPRIDTGLTDLHGNKITVACSTCHTTRKSNSENRSIADMNEFHTELKFSHGTVSCLSCHDATDYDSLKLADGARVAFSNVLTLCAQCHGPQMVAYEHGAHGGMTGHWDLSRGPRERNNCIDCHHPHMPQFPKMRPTFKPKDRFLEPPRTAH
jgi:hypothetical protein